MSNLHKKTKHHEPHSCESTAHKREQSWNEELIKSQQEPANMIISLQQNKHVSPLLSYGIVELWSVDMVQIPLKIIVKTVLIYIVADRKYQHHTWILYSANKS
jgi:hypothetical protein